MRACLWPVPRPPGGEPLPPMPRPAPPLHVACSSPCPGFGVVVRQVPTRAAIVPAPQNATRPDHSVDGPRRTAESEADAARDDERLTTTHFPASLGERGELAALQLERGTTEQVQARLGVGDARATGRADGRVHDVQAAARVRTKGAPRGHCEPVRDVAVDLPVVEAHTARRAGEEVVERDDAIERRLGKQGLQGEYAPAADPEIVIAAPVELHPERRAVGAGGRGTGRRAPLSRELCRGQPDGGEEQDTADQLPHTKPPREE